MTRPPRSNVSPTIYCKHKFKPRYSEKYPEWMATKTSLQAHGYDPKEKVYECDVCIKCGKVVKP